MEQKCVTVVHPMSSSNKNGKNTEDVEPATQTVWTSKGFNFLSKGYQWIYQNVHYFPMIMTDAVSKLNWLPVNSKNTGQLYNVM